MSDKRLFILVTHGDDNPEKATIPYVIGNTALASDIEVVIGLQASGVSTACSSCYKHIFAAGFPPLKELVDSFLDMGGKIIVCGPCIKSRQISPDEELIKGAKVVNAATFVNEIMKSNNVVSY